MNNYTLMLYKSTNGAVSTAIFADTFESKKDIDNTARQQLFDVIERCKGPTINGRPFGYGKITRENIVRCIQIAGIQGNFEMHHRELKLIADEIMLLLEAEQNETPDNNQNGDPGMKDRYILSLKKRDGSYTNIKGVFETDFTFSESDEHLLITNLHSAMEAKRLTCDHLQRVITLPPPDDGMRWSEGKLFDSTNNIQCYSMGLVVHYEQIPIEPQKRAYDWSKTGLDVLVSLSLSEFFCKRSKLTSENIDRATIAPIWQPHDGSACPVDGDSCIVEVRDDEPWAHGAPANTINWSKVTSWRFVRLRDNVVWNLSTEDK